MRPHSCGARLFAGVAFTALVPLLAVETRSWTQSEMADFEKGTLTRLSLSSNGRLHVAPLVKELYDPSVTFLWAVARDARGNIYAGGGNLGTSKAKLAMIDPQGRARTLAELDGLMIQSIAIDRQDRVYAATSPDGKVFRVDASGKAEVFYDPKTKYIWALAFAASGDLFVGTGDQGEIHRVTPAGAGSVFFRSEESHVRSLAVDQSGNIVAGTDPSGLILRVSPAGEGFVLYQGNKREVTALAVAPDGAIYAAGAGNKTTATLPAAAPAPVVTQTPAAAAAGVTVTVVPAAPAQPAPATIAPAPAITGGSEVYRIQADGYPRKVWSHAQDLVYALAIDSSGRLVIGTGNKGAVYRIENDHVYTRLLSLPPTQVTAFAAAPGGKLFAVTGNIGKVFSVGPELEASGTLESDVLDAGAFSYWGRVLNVPEAAPGVSFETRSGNLSRAQRNWSPWAKLNGGRVTSPPARFFQYRATLTVSAELAEVNVAYLMKNVAPVVDELELTPVNYRFPAPVVLTTAATPTMNLPPLGRRSSSAASGGDSGGSTTVTFAKGQIGVRWLSSDDNGDTLIYKVETRGAAETTWKLVRDKIRERYTSWDSTAFPDGKYVVRVTASDSPSNPPGEALEASRESDTFLIDNTPPEITGLAGAPAAGGKIEVRFHARDALNILGKAEYSLNGGEWLVVEPTTRLTDSLEHDYRFSADRGTGEITIAVRVADEYLNEAVAKTTVR